MAVPHALALDECTGRLFVADRENGRVLELHNIGAAPTGWQLAHSWDTRAAGGLPYALARAPGGDVYSLLWARPEGGGGGGGVSLMPLRAAPAAGAPPTWAVPGVEWPHSLALHAGAGGAGLLLYVGETRDTGHSAILRFSLGDSPSAARAYRLQGAAPLRACPRASARLACA